MKKIIGFIMACALILLYSLNKAVEETVDVMQCVPHIMDPPTTMDLSDTMIFHTKDTLNTKEK